MADAIRVIEHLNERAVFVTPTDRLPGDLAVVKD
jgi:hypothetical protein